MVGPGPDGMPIDRLELAVGLARLVSIVRRLSPSRELSLTTASTLATLSAWGPTRLTELAAREGVTQPAMTQLISRLERQGLAMRRGDAADGRVVHVSITPAGEELLTRRRAVRAARLAELLRDLPPGDEASIAAALPALRRLTMSPDRPEGGNGVAAAESPER
ncbi:MAG: MarR family transcriptional regulator [bacterium]|nr:MarR family transcriptional regulator [bacterium]